MPVNYLTNTTGEAIAVLVSINEWENLKNQYPDIIDIVSDLPQWQQELIEAVVGSEKL